MTGAIDEGAGKYVVIAHSSKSVPKFRRGNRFKCYQAAARIPMVFSSSAGSTGERTSFLALRDFAARASLVVKRVRILNVAAPAAVADCEKELVVFRNILQKTPGPFETELWPGV